MFVNSIQTSQILRPITQGGIASTKHILKLITPEMHNIKKLFLRYKKLNFFTKV